MTPEKEFKEYMYRRMRSFRFDEVSSRLYANLYVEPNPVSLEDLAKLSGYSLSATSTSMKYLEEIHIVLRMKIPGSRKIFFLPVRDISHHVAKHVENLLELNVKLGKEKMPKIIQNYEKMCLQKDPAYDPKKHQIMKDHVKNVQFTETFAKKIQKILEDMAESK